MTTPQSEWTKQGNNSSANTEGPIKNEIQGEKRALEAQDLTGQVLASNDSASKKIAAEYRGIPNTPTASSSVNSWVMEQINDLYK